MPRTKNYFWSKEDLLGSGAVGDVYSGYHIASGDSVAIKVMKSFMATQLERLLSLQERETEVLRKLDHPNIVKLVDVEPEDSSDQGLHQRKVIVMELCTGGSLYTLLSSPKNVFGLDDKEFLNVLKGITSGMEKLHSEHIVHRDIKPGNIMRFIGDDGRTIYKLVDFGAARELHSEQEFESIYGTEEYLHPGIYEKAFMNKNSEQCFKHSVDLWSIGATLFHVASGQIPFQSFGGRKDRDTMYEIIANKKSGDISGSQESQKGRIIYNQHLPKFCLMSQGLRPHVEDLLRRLLETEDSKMLSFEKFFQLSNNITKKKIVSVFNCNTTDLLKIYIDANCNFQRFQDLLEEQSKVLPTGQMLLHENLDFVEQFGGDEKVLSCCEVVDSNPVYLFYDCDTSALVYLDDSKYSTPNKPNNRNSKNDLTFARNCCESLNFIKRNVDRCLLRQKLISAAAVMLIRFLGRKYDKINAHLEHLVDVIRLHGSRVENNELLIGVLMPANEKSCIKNAAELLPANEKSCIKYAADSLARQKQLFIEIENSITTLQVTSADLESGLQDSVTLWVGEKSLCKEDDCCSSKIDVLLKKINGIHSKFEVNKLSNDKRTIECQKLENYCKSAKFLIEDHCQSNARQLVDYFRYFMRHIWSRKEGIEKFSEHLKTLFDRQRLLFDNMNQTHARLKGSLNVSLNVSRGIGDPGLSSVEGMDNSIEIRKDKLVLIKKKGESAEKRYAKQLCSLTPLVNNTALAFKLASLAETNNKLIEDITTAIEMSISPSGDVGELTFQDKPSVHHDDITLT